MENPKTSPELSRNGLLSAFNAVREALMSCDTESLKSLYDEEFRSHTVRGEVEGRAAVLEAYRPGSVRLDIYEVDDLAAEVVGEAGILTGRGWISGVFENVEFRHHVRFVDIYRWRDGRWRYYFSQSTEVIPDAPSRGAG